MSVNDEFEIAKVENSSDELASLRNVAFGHANSFESNFELIETEGIVIATKLSWPEDCRPTLAKISIHSLVQ